MLTKCITYELWTIQNLLWVLTEQLLQRIRSGVSKNQVSNSSTSKEQVDKLIQENQSLKQKIAELEAILQQISDVHEKSQEVKYSANDKE